jgi:hypothetical protein
LILKPDDYLKAAQALDVEVQTADLVKDGPRLTAEAHSA